MSLISKSARVLANHKGAGTHSRAVPSRCRFKAPVHRKVTDELATIRPKPARRDRQNPSMSASASHHQPKNESE